MNYAKFFVVPSVLFVGLLIAFIFIDVNHPLLWALTGTGLTFSASWFFWELVSAIEYRAGRPNFNLRRYPGDE